MKPFLLFFLLLSVSFARAQTSSPGVAVSPSTGAGTSTRAATTDERAVMDAEKQRFDAQVSKNYAALDKLLADDLVYTHSNGNVDGKQSYIQSIREGKSNYAAVEPQEQKVRVYGNTAVINGVCLVRMNNNNQPTELKLRYTDVYVKKGGQWQLATWQSLRLAN